MSLCSSLTRGLALAAATGALVTGVVVAPAAADDGGGNDDPGVTQQDDGDPGNGSSGTGNVSSDNGNVPSDNGNVPSDTGNLSGTGDLAGQDGSGRYRGVVTARGGLWLRDRPDRGSRRVRFVRQGQAVSIFCRTRGGYVDGNPFWYMLTDGTWAWGSARYINTVGPTPRWC